MTRPKTNPLKPYEGTKDILDEYRTNPKPERELWAAVILHAIQNLHFKTHKWHEDLIFIAGGENWNWVCTQLGIDPKRASKGALRAAYSNDFTVIHKH